MSYISGITAATVASAVLVMLCSGSRHEKLCASVCCAFIALSALLPLRSAVIGTAAELKRDVMAERETETDRVVAACARELERRTAAAVSVKFPESAGCTVSITYDDKDVSNVIVTECNVTLEGADREEVEEFVGELLCCDKVNVEITGGDRNEN